MHLQPMDVPSGTAFAPCFLHGALLVMVSLPFHSQSSPSNSLSHCFLAPFSQPSSHSGLPSSRQEERLRKATHKRITCITWANKIYEAGQLTPSSSAVGQCRYILQTSSILTARLQIQNHNKFTLMSIKACQECVTYENSCTGSSSWAESPSRTPLA